MGKVCIDALEPGMVLEADLMTPDGRLFLACGAVLTHMHIRTCRVWGIAEAAVEGHGEEEPLPSEVSWEVMQAARELARHRFTTTNHRHPAVREAAKLFVESMVQSSDRQSLMDRLASYEEPVGSPELVDLRVDLGELLASELELASLPNLFYEISEAVNDPRSSAAYIADIISKDVAIAIRLLRLVNTPFYGFPSRIDTLSRAVTIVGANQLCNLALGVSVLTAFDGVPRNIIDLKAFWLHSIMCGTLARLFASHHGIVREERFFVAGLLHDVGRLVMLRNVPECSLSSFRQERHRRIPLHDAETFVWGTTHSEIGACLLEHWKLPRFLETLVRFHHVPENSPMTLETAILHVADFMTNALGIGNSGGMYVAPLDHGAWDCLNISPNELAVMTEQAERQSRQIIRAFFNE